MLSPAISFAQNIIEYSNYKVGDIVPDILFTGLTKYKTTDKNLSEFTEKLLIIDFWATWCAPCVAMLPRMDSLRREFKDDLIFISITDQPKLSAEPFLEKVEKNHKGAFDIPVIYEDTTIRKLFPHRLIPHYIWLDVKARKVIAITGLQHITRENLRNYFRTGIFGNVTEKNDKRLDYSSSQSLLSYLTGLNEKERKFLPKQYANFWNYIQDLSPGITAHLKDSINNTRITARNIGPRSLMSYAFGEGRKFFQETSVLVETKDKDKLYTNLTREPFRKWIAENGLTYEISVLPENRDKIFKMMQTDLINYFHRYNITIEKRKSDCLVLVSIGSNELARTKGTKSQVLMDQFGYHAKNISIDDLFLNLSFYYLSDSPLLVNETGINFNIDIDLDVPNFKNLNQLNKGLGNYGLKFVEKEAMGEFLVIRDKNQNYGTE
ncbi:putative Redoxin domain protein [Sphingobacterium sp. PM2-P1-29]|nr:putative Redoxin domain protein [Sphingobacterium sp. PM2-P1-29]